MSEFKVEPKDKVRADVSRATEDEERYIEVNSEHFEPLARWWGEHEGDRVNHELYREYTSLYTEVMIKGSDIDDWTRAMDDVAQDTENAVMHLWDVRGEVRPWLVERAQGVLLANHSSVELPKVGVGAFRREEEYRGGKSAAEMIISDMTSVVVDDRYSSDEMPHDMDEIDEAKEDGRGTVDYDHNIDQYF